MQKPRSAVGTERGLFLDLCTEVHCPTWKLIEAR
jgi:hypothetical protein